MNRKNSITVIESSFSYRHLNSLWEDPWQKNHQQNRGVVHGVHVEICKTGDGHVGEIVVHNL